MKASPPAGPLVAFFKWGLGGDMVSMYVDIRQAAELLAKFSPGHGLPHVAIEMANEIKEAARRGGLQFYTQYRDPSDGLMHVNDPANLTGAFFSIEEDEQGRRYVKPNGRIEGGDLKAIMELSGHAYTPGPNDGEWVADCVVSIEDLVNHPHFGFPKEKQNRIIEAHKAAQAKSEKVQAQALPKLSTAERRQDERWKACIDAGLPMPNDTYAQYPRGVGKVAKSFRITMAALREDLNKYRERNFRK